MAEAVMNLFPGTKVAIGPAIEHGFYYDFDLPTPITQNDLARIEKEMRRLLSTPQNFVKEVVTRQQALDLFKDQPFKCELINDLPPDAEISIYRSGNFVDLCKGPHVANSKEINAQSFKLEKIAGAYWRGDEKRPMLTRIYGTAWETPNDLKTYLTMQAEAEKQGSPLCVLDGAFLMDVNVRQMVDQVWAISAERETRIRRLAEGRKISRQAAERIMQNQISPQQYAAYADAVLMTDEGMESIAPEIAGRLAELRQKKVFN